MKLSVVAKEICYRAAYTGIYTPKETSLFLQSDRKKLKEAIAGGHLAVMAQTSAEGLSQGQMDLYELYNNMAAEIVHQNVTSHETISHISVKEAGRDTYRLLIPYAKACDAEHIYQLIHKKQEIMIRAFFVDMFGNRMANHVEVPWKPVYTDKLISFDAYEGLSVYCIYTKVGEDENRIRTEVHFIYVPKEDDEEVENMKTGVLQLKQPDVTVTFQTSYMAEEMQFEKEKLIAFFEDCVSDTEENKELVMEFSVQPIWKENALYQMIHQITIRRDEALCLENAPEEVQCVTQTIERMDKHFDLWKRFHFFESGQMQYTWNLIEGQLVKEKEPLVTYGFVPFQRVTGAFRDPEGNVYAMNSIDMNMILENYLNDLNMLFQPENLYQWYKDEVCRACLPDLFALREKTAEGLAKRIRPLETAEVSQEALCAMQKYAKQLFWSKIYLDRKELVFLQSYLELAHIEGQEFQINGVIGEGQGMGGGFPVGREKQVYLHGCIETEEWFDLSQVSFRMRNIADVHQGYYIPHSEAEGTELLTFTENAYSIRAAVQYQPQAPIPLTFEKSEEAITIQMQIRGVNEDRLYMTFGENLGYRRCAAQQSDWIWAMEQYRTKAPEFLRNLTAENLKQVIILMNGVCEALKTAPLEIDTETGEYALQFEADAQGRLTRLVSVSGVYEKNWRIFYANSHKMVELKQENNSYVFPEKDLPMEESDILLKFICPCRVDWNPDGGKTFIARNKRVNSTDLGKEAEKMNPVFRLVSNKIEL